MPNPKLDLKNREKALPLYVKGRIVMAGRIELISRIGYVEMNALGSSRVKLIGRLPWPMWLTSGRPDARQFPQPYGKARNLAGLLPS